MEKTEADYKNWVPAGMIRGFLLGSAAALLLFLGIVLLRLFSYRENLAGGAVLLVIAICLFAMGGVLLHMYRTFDYKNPDALSWRIIRGVASCIRIPEGGTCLDVGCGSGALTIEIAKRNPSAAVTGCDRWGKEYASFSQKLCEQNARAEKVQNAVFVPGDAAALPFADGTFDALTSNYVYHNIPSRDRQALLLETLRVLKDGGTFAIHDLMSADRYGDMEQFMEKLRDDGYRNVELIPTGNGKFMTAKECGQNFLSGTALLVGEKHRGENR